jgi:hypothetical protein
MKNNNYKTWRFRWQNLLECLAARIRHYGLSPKLWLSDVADRLRQSYRYQYSSKWRNFPLIFKGEDYYICGLPAMVAIMRYVTQSSKHLPGPSKKSIRITCSRTAETWRTSCAEAKANLQARNTIYAHRVYIRQVRAVGLYFIQPP